MSPDRASPETGFDGLADISIGDESKPGVLYGPWVTSHVGLLQRTRELLDPWGPPQTAGYDISYKDGEPDTFDQREGFFHTAAVTYYDFDGQGRLYGYSEHVRGGYNQYKRVNFKGTYEAWLSELASGHTLYWGRIHAELPIGAWSYFFVMKSRYEAEWVWTPQPLAAPPANKWDQDPPLMARGTLTKVRYAGWLGRAIQNLILG